MSPQSESLVTPSGCACETTPQPPQEPQEPIRVEPASDARGKPSPTRVAKVGAPVPSVPVTAVSPLAYGDGGGGLVFAIGLVGYDFGTEARRDSFKQQMRPVLVNFTTGELIPEIDPATGQLLTPDQIRDRVDQGFREVPANPFDTRQMVAYLRLRPDEAKSLIWTLNLELTPIYNIEPVGPFAEAVYKALVDMLDGQSQAEGSVTFVERVSIPAVLSGQSTRLFSGQMVPQILVDATRGMYSWKTTDLVQQAIAVAAATQPQFDPELLRFYLRGILNKLYYEYRNLGITSPDRALNFAATNVFQLTQALVNALIDPNGSKTLERIDVLKSPYGRIDSDCWDVQLKFLDPENTTRAYSVLRFTLDVSDKLPVTLGSLVNWFSAT